MGSLARALVAAATQAGAEIRTHAEVQRILVKDASVTGVVLSSGEGIAARIVISNADPPRTLLRLVDPVHLDPDFARQMQNYRCLGTVAKVNLALTGLPSFSALESLTGPAQPKALAELTRTALAGRIQLGPEIDYLERAFDASKYGAFSPRPYMDAAIPSITDPSLAPPEQHVMSVNVQFAPFKLKSGDWNSQRDALGDAVTKTLAEYAPNLPGLILHRQVITPLDLEDTYALTGGHIYHGELGLDQLFTLRPLLGWARYRTPIRGLYLCGSGTHPGSGLTGASGRNAARQILRDAKRLT
jgi:phytoene dehydrogenase-like protein